jgi:two-component system chemotaxis response regulator CheB
MSKVAILIVEDDKTTLMHLKYTLKKAGFDVAGVGNGKEALVALEKQNYDIVLTDWMMPNMDGIALIRSIRTSVSPIPIIIMMTALTVGEARQYALESGADDFIEKPFEINKILSLVESSLARRKQPVPLLSSTATTVAKGVSSKPEMVGIGIASSTGGPHALTELFKTLPVMENATFFIVQHGPQWALEVLCERLNNNSALTFQMGRSGLKIEPNTVCIAPADMHMLVTSSFTFAMSDAPKENYVRPSADPLFTSIASVFGPLSAGLVMTGMGRDGTKGAAEIVNHKGTLLVQSPESSVVDAMPQTVISSGIDCRVVPLKDIATELTKVVSFLAQKL